MENSRNIIKAIDALTLKAGGEAVDSKNITEAIDNLKAVYDQKAIGIDKTLTQEGLAADAKAVGDISGLYNKGSYQISGYSFSGYITGSGNYVAFFIPCVCNLNNEYSVRINNGSYVFIVGDEGRIEIPEGTACTVTKSNNVGLMCELTLPEHHDPNFIATVLLTCRVQVS